MTKCFLLLGTNIGDKTENLLQAKLLLSKKVGKIITASSLYETSAWGKEDQDDFLNQVILVNTELPSQALLSTCLAVEKQLGRVRFERWGERLIDVDILYFGEHIIESLDLKVPHPEIQNRRFALAPLMEVAADFVHPVLKRSNKELLHDCKDLLKIRKLNN